MPAITDEKLLKPSKQFTKHVLNVVNSIAAFVIVYILLFVAAIIIACAMAVLGYVIMANVHMFIILLLGVGFVLSGLMLVFFLIKFIFRKNNPIPNRYEITESDQPVLFEFIRKLTTETGAPFPKHIYLTPEVNASVFFDSSFWSMFFPVKKNLNIGLALVNTLNQSEFKAVMAHEFGHFSQRSMRFGSYVYNLNKVIYNMLYENKGYETMMNTWARWHNVLRLTAVINIKIVKCIQYILKKMYISLNRNYMGLSREMEFHADAIAAYYSGSDNMASALRRLDAADNCYNILLNFLNGQLNQKRRSANIYSQHLVVLKLFAHDKGLSVDEHGVPMIRTEIVSLKNSRIIIYDQWASHPTTNEREKKMDGLNIAGQTLHYPAWLLFKDANLLQEHFTTELYAAVGDYKDLEIINDEEFSKYFNDEAANSKYNEAYKGFYDNRQISSFDIDEAISNASDLQPVNFDDLFTDDNCNLPKAIDGMRKDIAQLDMINNNDNKEINTFDFEGIKYVKQNAAEIKEIIHNDLETTQEQLKTLDKRAFQFFYISAKTANLQQSLVDNYKRILSNQQTTEQDYNNYSTIMTTIRPIYNKMKKETIYATVNEVYDREKTVKARIKEIIAKDEIAHYITSEQQKSIDKYLSKNWIYYLEPSYDNNAIEIFKNGINAYISIICESNFQQKKLLFNFQLTLLN